MDPARRSLYDSLDASGKLDTVRAQLRAVLFQTLHNEDATTASSAAAAAAGGGEEKKQQAASSNKKKERQQLVLSQFPAESLMVHELIRDYMQWAGLHHSLSVFQAEAKIPSSPVPRKVMASESGVPAAPPELPLLFSMLHECKENQTY